MGQRSCASPAAVLKQSLGATMETLRIQQWSLCLGRPV